MDDRKLKDFGYESHEFVHGRVFGSAMIEAGILPSNTTRFIIDCDVTGAVRLHYSTYAYAGDLLRVVDFAKEYLVETPDAPLG